MLRKKTKDIWLLSFQNIWMIRLNTSLVRSVHLLDRLAQWAAANFVRFNKAKFQLPLLGYNNPRQWHRLGRVAGELSRREEPGRAVWQQLNTSQLCSGDQEGQGHPGLYQKQCDQKSQRKNFPPVLSNGEAMLQILCWNFWSHVSRRALRCWSLSREEQNWERVWNKSTMRSGWEG